MTTGKAALNELALQQEHVQKHLNKINMQLGSANESLRGVLDQQRTAIETLAKVRLSALQANEVLDRLGQADHAIAGRVQARDQLIAETRSRLQTGIDAADALRQALDAAVRQLQQDDEQAAGAIDVIEARLAPTEAYNALLAALEVAERDAAQAQQQHRAAAQRHAELGDAFAAVPTWQRLWTQGFGQANYSRRWPLRWLDAWAARAVGYPAALLTVGLADALAKQHADTAGLAVAALQSAQAARDQALEQAVKADPVAAPIVDTRDAQAQRVAALRLQLQQAEQRLADDETALAHFSAWSDPEGAALMEATRAAIAAASDAVLGTVAASTASNEDDAAAASLAAARQQARQLREQQQQLLAQAEAAEAAIARLVQVIARARELGFDGAYSRFRRSTVIDRLGEDLVSGRLSPNGAISTLGGAHYRETPKPSSSSFGGGSGSFGGGGFSSGGGFGGGGSRTGGSFGGGGHRTGGGF